MKKITQNLFLVPAFLQISIKQINMLKPFYMEPRQAVPKKHFVSKEENKCEEEINLIRQDRIGNMDWCKCGCECKPMETFAESIGFLL